MPKLQITLSATQNFLAAMALLTMAAIAGCLVFVPVPAPNHDYMIYVLGALSGALTTGAAERGIKALAQKGQADGQTDAPEA